VGPRTGLEAEARKKILCPCRGSNPDRPARNQTLYCLSYRGSKGVEWKEYYEYCIYRHVEDLFQRFTPAFLEVSKTHQTLQPSGSIIEVPGSIKSRPGYRLSWLIFLALFSQSLRVNSAIVP
jgi:hypothetical protein